MNIPLPEYKQTLPIQLVGMMLEPDVKVHDMNRQLEAAQKGGQSRFTANTGSSTLDLSKQIRREVSDKETSDPPGKGPLLKWSVANEGSIYGYLVYRSDAQAGPFLRINEDTIVAPPYAEGVVNSYRWRDTTALKGNTYWYSVGALKTNGEKMELVQPQRIVAK